MDFAGNKYSNNDEKLQALSKELIIHLNHSEYRHK